MRANPGQLKLGEHLREAAIAQVDQNAEPDWKALAMRAVEACTVFADFTTDDVWAEIDHLIIESGGLRPVMPREPRAMGAIMRAAQRERLIRPLDSWRLSARPECHRRPLRVWATV